MLCVISIRDFDHGDIVLNVNDISNEELLEKLEEENNSILIDYMLDGDRIGGYLIVNLDGHMLANSDNGVFLVIIECDPSNIAKRVRDVLKGMIEEIVYNEKALKEIDELTN